MIIITHSFLLVQLSDNRNKNMFSVDILARWWCKKKRHGVSKMERVDLQVSKSLLNKCQGTPGSLVESLMMSGKHDLKLCSLLQCYIHFSKPWYHVTCLHVMQDLENNHSYPNLNDDWSQQEGQQGRVESGSDGLANVFQKNNYNVMSSQSPPKGHLGVAQGEYKCLRSRDTCFLVHKYY